jgi:hypothetical protein
MKDLYMNPYALEKNELEKIAAGAGKVYEGQTLITTGFDFDAAGNKTFTLNVVGAGTLSFTLDENDIYQFDKVEGDCKVVPCVLFNSWVKQYLNKDWAVAIT